MNKKTALIILIVVIFLALLVFVYFWFFNNNQPNNPVNFVKNFFGGSITNQPNKNNNFPETENVAPQNKIIPRLRKLSSFPVAGAGMFEREATTTSLLVQKETGAEENKKITETVYRFVERSTGHIYETTSRDLSQKRITSTTIPKIYEAIFSNNGEGLTLSYIQDSVVQTLFAKINYPIQNSTSTENNRAEETYATIAGSYLPAESFSISKARNNDDLVFLKSFGQETTNLYKKNLLGKDNFAKIFSLNNSEWKTQVLNTGVISLNTKASYLSQGFLYFLNPQTGIFRKKVGNLYGLVSLPSPTGHKILFSYYDSGNIATALYDEKSNSYNSLKISTFPDDKCVWGIKNPEIVYCALPTDLVRGNFPDLWYQGKYHFNDKIVKIDTETFQATTLLEANSETQENLDVINMQLSPSEDYLMFMNKNDLYLWSLDIKQ